MPATLTHIKQYPIMTHWTPSQDAAKEPDPNQSDPALQDDEQGLTTLLKALLVP